MTSLTILKSLVLLVVHFIIYSAGLDHSEDVHLKNNTTKSQKFLDKIHLKKTIWKECSNTYSLTCLKLDIVSWVNTMDEEETLDVLPGISLVRENNSVSLNSSNEMMELSRDFSNDPRGRLDAFLYKQISTYLDTHSLRINFMNKEMAESARAKKGKKDGGMGMMLAAGAMMKGMLMALAMGGITAIAGKALMTGLISLVLSGIIGIKALTQGGHKSTTYEVVAKPVHTQSVSHSESHEQGHYGHSSYGRSFDLPPPFLLSNPSYKK
ncbi:hypothetical protein GWI33_007067 [Rhynchophorus ferrugineus]|uniref:Osiris 16 n=1 Tax=Rhynchophorus ferrugineus TaxID=354439 RepID=A0A834IKB0_RHYFE|nr:hypothetical protein GWI33_007067 [Rhynchophorus ferrugineus]